MQKLTTFGIIFAFAFGMAFMFAGGVNAASNTGLENSPVFEGSPGHWTNENNDDVRFDTDTHRRAVPGEGGPNADEESVVHDHRDASLVDPHRTWD